MHLSARRRQRFWCGHCGHLHAGHGANSAACTSCGEGELVPLFCPESLATRAKRSVLSRDCPFRHAGEALIIVGARASNLLSVVLGKTFASRHNDDFGGHAEPARNGDSASAQKVIAFSD